MGGRNNRGRGEDTEGRIEDQYNPTYTELSSDEEPNSTDSADSSDPDEHWKSTKALTDDDIESAYKSWKAAIEQGNETLAAFCVDEYPALDMFQFKWDNGDNALHVAVQQRHSRLVFYLLTNGCSVNEQNLLTQNCALHYAVRNADHKLVDLLLSWDADANLMNADKQTPIAMAQDLSDQNILDVLLEARAKLFGDDDDEEEQPPRMVTLNVESSPEVPRRTTSQRMEEWTAKRQIRDEIIPTAESDQSDSEVLSGDEYEDATDGASYTDLDKVRIKNRNPFTKMGRQKTVEAKKIINDSLKDTPLPKLEAWLEKKKPGGMVPTYQKRWIIVKGAHLLWSSKQRTIINDASREERRKFNGAIHLTTIEKVSPIQTSANNKFMVRAKDAKKDNEMREYIFRCQNKSERDFWVQGLKEHQRQYRKMMDYLSH